MYYLFFIISWPFLVSPTQQERCLSCDGLPLLYRLDGQHRSYIVDVIWRGALRRVSQLLAVCCVVYTYRQVTAAERHFGIFFSLCLWHRHPDSTAARARRGRADEGGHRPVSPVTARSRAGRCKTGDDATPHRSCAANTNRQTRTLAWPVCLFQGGLIGRQPHHRKPTTRLDESKLTAQCKSPHRQGLPAPLYHKLL